MVVRYDTEVYLSAKGVTGLLPLYKSTWLYKKRLGGGSRHD